MPRLLLATKNAHKARELRALLGAEWEVTDLNAYPEVPAPEETGVTFAENADLKALAAAALFPGLVLADDSGLEVDALGGAPGVYSARYAGVGATDAENRAKLLQELQQAGADAVRSARFQCVLALAREGVVMRCFAGTVHGTLLEQERGEGGFGYDPLFVPEGEEKSYAELPAEVKNEGSHRAQAVRQAVEFLRSGGGE